MRTLGLTQEEIADIANGPKRTVEAFRMLQFIAGRPKGATCDECSSALGLSHGSASPRFSELEHSGCLQFTGQKRRTESGGSARVCHVSPTADFHQYLTHIRRTKLEPKTGLLAQDVKVLTTVKQFRSSWHSVDSPEVRARLLQKLVRVLLTVLYV
jgi:hypothetical protein